MSSMDKRNPFDDENRQPLRGNIDPQLESWLNEEDTQNVPSESQPVDPYVL